MLYLCLFLPASLSILVSEKLRKEKRTLSELVIPYLGYAFMIATIMNMIVRFTNTSKIHIYSNSLFTFQFTMEYTWLSVIIAVSLPCLVYIISKVVQINISVKERSKNVKVESKNSKNNNENYKRKH